MLVRQCRKRDKVGTYGKRKWESDHEEVDVCIIMLAQQNAV